MTLAKTYHSYWLLFVPQVFFTKVRMSVIGSILRIIIEMRFYRPEYYARGVSLEKISHLANPHFSVSIKFIESVNCIFNRIAKLIRLFAINPISNNGNLGPILHITYVINRKVFDVSSYW